MLCGKPSRHGAPCHLDVSHVTRGERHDNGAFTWALRGHEQQRAIESAMRRELGLAPLARNQAELAIATPASTTSRSKR